MQMKTLTSALAILACSLSFTAHAKLVVTNKTQFDSTTKTFLCSTALGEAGVTHPGQTNTLTDAQVKSACLFSQQNCVADVFLTNNCSGPSIATVTMDIKSGIKSVEMKDNNYQIDYSNNGDYDFSVTLKPSH